VAEGRYAGTSRLNPKGKAKASKNPGKSKNLPFLSNHQRLRLQLAPPHLIVLNGEVQYNTK
jgi:hypothetical protein